jgi:hypothetical protein
VAERFLNLNSQDQNDVLEIVRSKTGRPAHLLEKDVWVVWTLAALFESPLADNVTFKGGTSLSKAYKVIDRFSEDIDLTYDIRKLIPDLIDGEDALPATRSQAGKWTKAVRDRLPGWISSQITPVLQAALTRDQLTATVEIGGAERDKVILHYPAQQHGTGYVSPSVVLEFGARATGEPHAILPVVCDMEGHITDISFPRARPIVMSVARTFWEKATAAHVYCAQHRIRSERYARHWYDLAALARSDYFVGAIVDKPLAHAVARHKSFFFIEKDVAGNIIDYTRAVAGHLQIVPKGDALSALADDYAKMVEDHVMLGDSIPFDQLMQTCQEIETLANQTTAE